jgi:hypothetical protein
MWDHYAYDNNDILLAEGANAGEIVSGPPPYISSPSSEEVTLAFSPEESLFRETREPFSLDDPTLSPVFERFESLCRSRQNGAESDIETAAETELEADATREFIFLEYPVSRDTCVISVQHHIVPALTSASAEYFCCTPCSCQCHFAPLPIRGLDSRPNFAFNSCNPQLDPPSYASCIQFIPI